MRFSIRSFILCNLQVAYYPCVTEKATLRLRFLRSPDDLLHELFQLLFPNHAHTQFPSFVELRPRITACNAIVRFLAYRARDASACVFDHLLRFVSGMAFERARQHKSLARQLRAFFFLLSGERHASL